MPVSVSLLRRALRLFVPHRRRQDQYVVNSGNAALQDTLSVSHYVIEHNLSFASASVDSFFAHLDFLAPRCKRLQTLKMRFAGDGKTQLDQLFAQRFHESISKLSR